MSAPGRPLAFSLFLILIWTAASPVAYAETPAPLEQRHPEFASAGYDAVKSEATGFFYTKKINDVWWFIDPAGKGFYAVGVGGVSVKSNNCERLGYSPYERAVLSKYGSPEAWAEATEKRLRDWGFNTYQLNYAGAKQTPSAYFRGRSFGLSFARQDGFPTVTPTTLLGSFPNVFSPEWPKFCDKTAQELCAEMKEDPWLLGYTSDNELAWGGPFGSKWGLFEEAWKKPQDDPAKKAWIAFLQARLKSASEFASNWGCPQQTWEELAISQEAVPPMTAMADDICTQWLKYVAEAYFREVSGAIRRYDPNHLYLGCRFTTDMQDVLDVCGQYCDVVTLNMYARFEPGKPITRYELGLLQAWSSAAGKPLMFTEWSFPSFDSGLPCSVGAGMRVETQQQRAACWEEFQRTLFQLPFVVGSEYFMWSDEPALGIASYHRENTNYGLVTVSDEPYQEVVDKAKTVNPLVYALHSRGEMPEGAPARRMASCLRDFSASKAMDGTPLLFPEGLLNISPGNNGNGAEWLLSLGKEYLASMQPLVLEHYQGYKWCIASECKLIQMHENDAVMAADYELSNRAAASTKTEGAYRSIWRLFIPKKNPGWVGMQCLMVENIGTETWLLDEIQCNLNSGIAQNNVQDTAFDLSLKWLPFYRNGTFMWDADAKIGVGASFLNVDDFDYIFYPQPGKESKGEFKRKVHATLAPGEKYATETPVAFFFPMEHNSPAHFARTVERLLSQVSE